MSESKLPFPLTRRNLVALALLRKGGGTKQIQKAVQASPPNKAQSKKQ
jgi:hypothetical protein